MLEDAAGIRRVVLACGTVDLRKGIDGLAMIIGDKYQQNPFDAFCGAQRTLMRFRADAMRSITDAPKR